MLHYANGNSVEGEEAGRSNVIHVHSKCIEWYVIQINHAQVIKVIYVYGFRLKSEIKSVQLKLFDRASFI